jgi:2-dehydro-3-deoxyphosphogluconate aldolase / (4S)-4-hydroxy-2-oxoglutarate aldolase
MTETAVPLARAALPDAIATGRVIAIARGLDPARMREIATAVADGGVRAFEITLNSRSALDAIAAVRAVMSEAALLVGAGTVLEVSAAEAAVAAGAQFLVMPHLDAGLVRWAVECGVPVFPGAFTPTEVLAAWRAGATAVKLFPASVAGPAFVRELHGPLPEIPVIPTGGVTAESTALFIRAGAAAVGVGSWLTGAGDPATIRDRSAQLVAAVRQATG